MNMHDNNTQIFWRSLAFNLCFFVWSLIASLLFVLLFISSQSVLRVGKPWAWVTLKLAEKICGITYEIRGEQYLTYEPVIFASKHQSAWDTIIFLVLFKAPTYVLKRELLMIPLWGWYLWRMRMIAINRSGKASSLKQMIRDAKAALHSHRPIIIFPEGTRSAPGAAPHYHPGIVAMYSQLMVPVVPVALNSGLYWGKNAFYKRPGKIILEFLPPIAPGLEKDEFRHRLQDQIETASHRLLEEGRKNAPLR
jgi:1-acyl-sn-glycerol-3-phosphate acyltransferase